MSSFKFISSSLLALSCICTCLLYGCSQSPAAIEYRGSAMMIKPGAMADISQGRHAPSESDVATPAISDTVNGHGPEKQLDSNHHQDDGVYDAALQTKALPSPAKPTFDLVEDDVQPEKDGSHREVDVVYDATLSTKTLPGPAKPTFDLVEDDVRPKNHGLIMPATGNIIASFGRSQNRFNDGVLLALRDGQEVVAAADGSVVYVGQEIREYGNVVIIEHKNDIITSYSQIKSASVRVGEKVKKGHVIGRAGRNRQSGGESRLLFSIRVNGNAVDPIKYISG